MKDFEQLAQDVVMWADGKGILDASNATVQMSKTLEECAEVLRELNTSQLDREALESEYGDVLVTLVIGMKMSNIHPTVALETAYNKINKRTGRMENGVFVKDTA